MTFKLFTVNNFKKPKINLNKKLNIILKYFFYRGDYKCQNLYSLSILRLCLYLLLFCLYGEFKHEVRQFQKPYDNQQAEQISLMV